MKMESRLSVPYVNETDYLDSLFERFDGKVDEVYVGLPSGYVGSARPIYYKGLDYEAIARKCHEHGAKLNALLNASCEGLEPYTSEGLSVLMSTVKRAASWGVDSFTVANPLYIRKIKDIAKVEVKASVICRIGSVQKAVFFEQLGADTINLDRDINRDLGRIKDIRDAVDCKLTLLVNEGCLLDCPFKHWHDNLIGHLSRVPPTQRTQIDVNPFAGFCSAMKEAAPAEILKSPWIRPEDVHNYRGLVDTFKISGRDLSAEDMLRIVDAYVKESYDGDLMDLLNVKVAGLHVPNSALVGFFEKVSGCDKNCGRCSYCSKLAQRIIRKDTVRIEADG